MGKAPAFQVPGRRRPQKRGALWGPFWPHLGGSGDAARQALAPKTPWGQGKKQPPPPHRLRVSLTCIEALFLAGMGGGERC